MLAETPIVYWKGKSSLIWNKGWKGRDKGDLSLPFALQRISDGKEMQMCKRGKTDEREDACHWI